MMAVYLVVVYAIARPFGAAAQAGFGIGMRIVQALFMPVVALGFAVAPVAGQNFGADARRPREGGVQDGEHDGGGAHAAAGASLCNIAPAALIGFFSDDPSVVAVGDEYLAHHLVELRRLGADLRRVQHVPGDGQHHPVADRLVQPHRRDRGAGDPALARCRDFELRWIWYLSAAAVLMQLAIVLLLLRREFRLRLDSMVAAPIIVESAPVAG